MPDAAKGRWLSNETVVKIISAIVGILMIGTVLVMNKYWELKAEDVRIIQTHDLFKQSVDSKFDEIIRRLKRINPEVGE